MSSKEIWIHVLNRFPVYVDDDDAVFGCLEKPLKPDFRDFPPLGDILDRKKGQPLLRDHAAECAGHSAASCAGRYAENRARPRNPETARI